MRDNPTIGQAFDEYEDEGLPSFGHRSEWDLGATEDMRNQQTSVLPEPGLNYYKSIYYLGRPETSANLNSSKIELQKLETLDSALNSNLESFHHKTLRDSDRGAMVPGTRFFETDDEIHVKINRNFLRK